MPWISQAGSVWYLKLVLRIFWLAKWDNEHRGEVARVWACRQTLPRWKRVIVASSQTLHFMQAMTALEAAGRTGPCGIVPQTGDARFREAACHHAKFTKRVACCLKLHTVQLIASRLVPQRTVYCTPNRPANSWVRLSWHRTSSYTVSTRCGGVQRPGTCLAAGASRPPAQAPPVDHDVKWVCLRNCLCLACVGTSGMSGATAAVHKIISPHAAHLQPRQLQVLQVGQRRDTLLLQEVPHRRRRRRPRRSGKHLIHQCHHCTMPTTPSGMHTC